MLQCGVVAPALALFDAKLDEKSVSVCSDGDTSWFMTVWKFGTDDGLRHRRLCEVEEELDLVAAECLARHHFLGVDCAISPY